MQGCTLSAKSFGAPQRAAPSCHTHPCSAKVPHVYISPCVFLQGNSGEVSGSTDEFCLVHNSVLRLLLLLQVWLRGGVHGAAQGCLQAGSLSKQEVVSFLPVFVPMPANFLWEEKCILQQREKNSHNVTGRDEAAKLLNEAWDEEGAWAVNCSKADRTARTNSCLWAVTTGIKTAHLGQAGEQTLGRIAFPLQCYGGMMLSSSSISVVCRRR